MSLLFHDLLLIPPTSRFRSLWRID